MSENRWRFPRPLMRVGSRGVEYRCRGCGSESTDYGEAEACCADILRAAEKTDSRPCPGCTLPLAVPATACFKCGWCDLEAS